MERNERNAIIQKIKKLMELQLSAENVGQSGEAFAAANAIHKLLTKYNLSLDEVTDEGNNDEKDGLFVSSKMPAHDEYGNWRDILMIKLAERNYCRSLGNIDQPSIMMLVGKKENVEIVIQLYNRLSEIFLLKAKNGLIAKYEEEEGNMTLEQQNDYMESYLLGCVDGLMEHLDSVEKNTEEKFLAIRWKSKINSWEEKHTNRENRIKVEVDIKEEDAYTSGIVEGRNTRLYQEIK